MVIAAAVEADGSIGHTWGKARTVAVAAVREGRVVDWQEYAVGWDAAHDQGTHGAHHARVVRFLREYGVETVLARHVGDGMRRTLAGMGVRLVEVPGGDARAAMATAAG